MAQRPDLVVVAPPPTPNGDLHVGHLSGPYLGADVFTRFERLRGRAVVSAISADDNQSYVVTTAERLGRCPRELARESHADIRHTLEQAGIAFDIVGRPDAAYDSFVRGYLDRLVDAGAFVERSSDALIDARTGRQLIESYVGGRCPVCFVATCGNICESCGHPNDPSRLIRPMALGAEGGITAEKVKAMVLPLERYRSRLENHYRRQRMRPELTRLLEALLERPLGDFPITYRSDWGLPVQRAGWESAVYNVWAEMYPGHLYWTQQAGAAAWERDEGVRYVQFIGFDNSFFYAVAHVAISLAADDAGLPVAPLPEIVTNQFYMLENSKFSTSQGHVIWGKELLAEWSADPFRLYLCLSNPETQESNFAVADMAQVLEERLVRPFERLRRSWNRMVRSGRVEATPDGEWASWQREFRRRFELSYAPETFSLRRAATTLTAYLDFFSSELEVADRDGLTCSAAPMAQLAVYATPLMPGFAETLAECAGIVTTLSWTSPPVQSTDELREIPCNLLELRHGQVASPERGILHVH